MPRNPARQFLLQVQRRGQWLCTASRIRLETPLQIGHQFGCPHAFIASGSFLSYRITH